MSKRKSGKSVWHYLKVYFLSLFVGLIIFAVGSFFNKPQFTCANSATCKSDLITSINNDAIAIFQGRKIIPPKIDLAMNAFKPVLGIHVSTAPKNIYVDLSTQTLYAYEGSTIIMKTLISSGKWGRTPTGNFNIWEKLQATRMAGGEGADAYDLPNVPWVMYFHNDFGLHGAYWHNNFGHPMSHGCVNMRLVDARELYAWVDGPTSDKLGTAVSICDQFKEPGTCMQSNSIN